MGWGLGGRSPGPPVTPGLEPVSWKEQEDVWERELALGGWWGVSSPIMIECETRAGHREEMPS